MRANVERLPEYDSPPIAEVVCGISFSEIGQLLAPHFGLFWSGFKEEYPVCQEQPPLASVVERVAGGMAPFELQLQDRPPLPRLWFISKGRDRILQMQRDRLLYNWRRLQPEDEYPRFSSVFTAFTRHYQDFTRFLTDSDLGELAPLQYELTYVNQIPQQAGWESLAGIGEVVSFLRWDEEGDRFLPQMESVQCRMSFRLPEGAGRLHVSLRNAMHASGGQGLLLLELTARGMTVPGTPFSTMEEWFELGHEWIVRGFTDLTTTDIQTGIWRRKWPQ